MLPYTQRNAVISLIFKKGETDKLKEFIDHSVLQMLIKKFLHMY